VYKVIVVDDEEKLTQNLAMLLEMNEFEVKTFSKAFNAISHVNQNPCDVAVCDIHMPGIKGDVLCSELRKTDPYLQCIIITAYADPQIVEKLLGMGIVDIFEKPVDGDVLISAVRQAGQRKARLKSLGTQKENTK